MVQTGAPRVDGAATTYAVTALGGALVSGLSLVVPGLVAPGRRWAAVLGIVFLLLGATWTLRSGRLRGRTVHAAAALALLASCSLTWSIDDPDMRLLAAGWNVLVPLFLATALSPRGVAGYGVLAAALSVAMTAGPSDPSTAVTRALITAGGTLLPVLAFLILRLELEQTIDRARLMATTDSLTGLLNRRGPHDRFAATVPEVGGDRSLVAVLVLDLDHFKRVNDTCGHEVGDQVLELVAGCLSQQARPGDLTARLGGEELAVVTTVRDPAEAHAHGDRLRRSIAAAGAPWAQTTSVGVAVAEAAAHVPVEDLFSRLLTEADLRLYEAKGSGRDRVVGPTHLVPGHGGRSTRPRGTRR